MKRLDAGISGTWSRSAVKKWQDLVPGKFWADIIDILSPGPVPRKVQALALGNNKVLDHRRNLIISAPTNSGKSLVSTLILIEAVRRGRRAVLLEPLRATAREKMEDLKSVSARLTEVIGRPVTVRISTGDYRLEDESFSAPPPDQGEIIIATPERFDTILRNPEHDKWISSIDALCIDEAHLINSPRRGPTIEYLLTSLLCLPAPPRIVFLSATLGDVGRACEWLSPCEVIAIAERHPPLCKEVWALSEQENVNDIVIDWAKDVLVDHETRLLIFVYQTRSAERLAAALHEILGNVTGNEGSLAYHAQMSSTQREFVRCAFSEGRSRCIVTTTALGLGVNLPATHVMIRDNSFPGVGPLSTSDLLQMLGRAGRGDQAGTGVVLVRSRDHWQANELASALKQERLPSLTSYFEKLPSRTQLGANLSDADTISVVTRISAYMARYAQQGCTLEELQSFFGRSLGGTVFVDYIPLALAWLTDQCRVLAFQDESKKFRLTALGLEASQAMLPLNVASGLAQLIRDLLSVDSSDKLLGSWRHLDHLIVIHLLYGQAPRVRPFSAPLADQVDAWMERHPEMISLLYRKWITGTEQSSRAIEILGSLSLRPKRDEQNQEEWARRIAYVATFRSIVLYERGQGTSIEDLERRFTFKGMEGIEERWRDDTLWLLSGIARILDLRCFYFHLRQECDADRDRIRHLKRILVNMRKQTFELQNHLKYCSPLGSILRSFRRSKKSGSLAPSIQTIRKLEQAGINDLTHIMNLRIDDLVNLGIRRDLARQIRRYVQHRLQ